MRKRASANRKDTARVERRKAVSASLQGMRTLATLAEPGEPPALGLSCTRSFTARSRACNHLVDVTTRCLDSDQYDGPISATSGVR